MADQDQQIHVEVSRQSIRSASALNANLAKSRAEAQELVSLFKSLQGLSKGFQAQGVMQGTPGSGSLNQMFEGERRRGAARREQLAFEGSSSGKRVSDEKQYARHAREGLTYLRQQQTTQQALNLSARTKSSTLEKIDDLQTAINRKLAVEKRLGNEALHGKRSTVQAFERQRQTLDGVVRRLQEQKKTQEQINRLNTRNPVLEQSQEQYGRRRRMQSLFGDGGASLFAVQAGISANYMALNGVRNTATETARFSAELDEAMRNLQAITVTTDGDLQNLKDSLIEISEQTKFTAVEVAEAAVTLGQAGLSIREIENAMPAVALLATATSTELAKAVDIATSTLGVFRMESAQMAHVANTMTAAVNQSKLNIDKLTLGLQYSGNIAAQSGVRFEELTAALGAMANAGIRSGSTLGTGMRQILIALQKPSNTFLDTLGELGLTMHDVDVGSQGLYGALKNLRDAGFSATDAIRSFEVRAAAAYNAVSNNLDSVLDLERSFLSSAAAMQANETQMRALVNQGRRFGSVFKSVAEVALEPFVLLTRDLLRMGGDLFSWIRKYETGIRVLGTAFASLTTAAGAFMGLRLLRGLTKLPGMLRKVGSRSDGAAKGVGKMGTSAGRAGTAVGALAAGLAFVPGPMGAIAGAVFLATTAFLSFRNETQKAQEDLDRLQTNYNRATGQMEETASKISSVEGEIRSLTEREDALNDNQEMLEATTARVREQFVDMGLDLDSAQGSVENVRSALVDLRDELAEAYVVNIKVAEGELEQAIEQGGDVIGNLRSRIAQMSPGGQTSNGAQIRQIIQELQNDDLSAVQIRKLLGDLQLQEQELRPQVPAAGTLTVQQQRDPTYVADRRGLRVLQDLIPAVEQLMGEVQDQSKREQDAEGLASDRRTQVQRNSPSVRAVSTELGSMEAEITRSFNELQSTSSDLTLTEQMDRARGVANGFLDRLLEFRRSVAAYPSMESGLENELLNNINNLERDLLQRLNPIEDMLGDEQEVLDDMKLSRLQERVSDVRNRLGDPEQGDDLEQLRREAREVRLAQFEQEMAMLDRDSDTTLAVRRERAARLQRGLDQDLDQFDATVGEAGSARRVEGMQASVRGMGIQQTQLQNQAGEATNEAQITANVEARADLLRQIAQTEMQILRIQNQDNSQEEAIALAEREQELIDDLADLREDEARALERHTNERLEAMGEIGQRQQQLAENEENLALLRDRLEGTTPGSDQAVTIRAAIEALKDQRDEIVNVEGRLDSMNEVLDVMSIRAGDLSIDEERTARAAIEEMRDALADAKTNLEDLNNADLTGLELGLQGTMDILTNLGGPTTSPGNYAKYDAAAASGILDLIAQSEGTLRGSNANARGYDTELGYGQYSSNTRPITGLTLRELLAVGDEMIQNNKHIFSDPSGARGSSAMGKYQITGSNIREFAKRWNLDLDQQTFSPELQDQMALAILNDAGGDVSAVKQHWVGARKVPDSLIQQALEGTGYQGIIDRDVSSAEDRKDEWERQRDEYLQGLDDQFRALIDGYDADFNRYDAGMEQGSMEANRGVGGMESVLDQARQELTQRAQKLEEISAITDRTAEQEEERLRMSQEYGSLLGFIEQREEEILRIKEEQGMVTLDLNKSVGKWAKDNLNIGKGMEQGVLGTLDRVKSGFATMFTDMSNRSQSAGETFRQFGLTVIKSMQQMMAEMAAMAVMRQALGFILPGFGAAAGDGSVLGTFAQGLGMGARGAASGTIVRGSVSRDSERYNLMDGEAVLRRSAVQSLGEDEVRKLNAMGNRARATSTHQGAARPEPKSAQKQSVNVYVVAPDQKPVPGPNEIVAYITDDMARGGSTNKLVKSISMGDV